MKGLHLHRKNKGRLIHFAVKLILASREGIENDKKFIVNLYWVANTWIQVRHLTNLERNRAEHNLKWIEKKVITFIHLWDLVRPIHCHFNDNIAFNTTCFVWFFVISAYSFYFASLIKLNLYLFFQVLLLFLAFTLFIVYNICWCTQSDLFAPLVLFWDGVVFFTGVSSALNWESLQSSYVFASARVLWLLKILKHL